MGEARKAERYTARANDERFTSDERDFLWRRTIPLLDRVGLSKPITHLLQEAYLQGLRDASDVLLEAS
jgi:hypothetical protein